MPGEILLWHGKKDISETSLLRLLLAVKNGASILGAINTWSTQNLQGKSISKFAQKLGMRFNGDMASDEETWIAQNKASASHAIDLLNLSVEKPDKIISYGRFRNSIKSLIANRKDLACCIDAMLTKGYQELVAGKGFKVPQEKQEISSPNEQLAMTLLELQQDIPSSRPEMLHWLDFFPGIPTPTSAHGRVNIRVEFKAVVKGSFETGYYALPGETVKVDVQHSSGAPLESWMVQISANSDDVSDKRKSWKRWPSVCRTATLSADEATSTKSATVSVSITNPFGGGVYVRYTGKKLSSKSANIVLKIHGVVMAPFLEGHSSGSIRAWPGRRVVPGPWADIVGKLITVTLPAELARRMPDPASFIIHFDKVVEQFHFLRGTDPYRSHRQWFVMDVTTTNGYLHAGYPIVSGTLDSLDKMHPIRYWAWYHEIGHNMQKSEWTFDKQVEITCNIFTLYGTMVLDKKVNVNKRNMHYEGGKKYVAKPCTVPYTRHNDGAGLVAHYQLIEHFGFGAYKEVFRRYRMLKTSQLPQKNDAKISLWVKIFSQVVGYNIAPFYEFWCYPVSQSVKNTLASQNLSPWLPDDEVTRSVPQKIYAAAAAYPGLKRDRRIYGFTGQDCFQCSSEPLPARMNVREEL